MVTGKSDETLIIYLLGGISIICIICIAVLALFGGEKNDALNTLGSLCVGALASRISQQGKANGRASDDEALEILGRAATKKIIADALRRMEE